MKHLKTILAAWLCTLLLTVCASADVLVPPDLTPKTENDSLLILALAAAVLVIAAAIIVRIIRRRRK